MDTAQQSAATPPTDAFRFASPFEFAAPESGQGPRKIRGVAYTGDILSHPYWGSVIFDLATTEAPARMPVLVDHDRGARAGVAQLRITTERIEIGDGFLLPNATGNDVAADADAGFPWQLSVHIEPREIQMLSAGETSDVNGRKVEGPATVFRHSLIREVSFTPTGVDANTSAAVFSVGARTKEAPMTVPTAPAAPAAAPEAAPAPAVPPAAPAAQASADAGAALAAVTAERDAAVAELAKMRGDTRMSAVKALFSDLGRTFSDDAAKPYLSLGETAFAAVAADLRATKPKAPAALFSHQATAGASGTQADASDPHKFAAAVRAEQDKAAKEGRSINVLEAARIVRESASGAA